MLGPSAVADLLATAEEISGRRPRASKPGDLEHVILVAMQGGARTPREIATVAREDNRRVAQALYTMRRAGRVERVAHGSYAIRRAA